MINLNFKMMNLRYINIYETFLYYYYFFFMNISKAQNSD